MVDFDRIEARARASMKRAYSPAKLKKFAEATKTLLATSQAHPSPLLFLEAYQVLSLPTIPVFAAYFTCFDLPESLALKHLVEMGGDDSMNRTYSVMFNELEMSIAEMTDCYHALQSKYSGWTAANLISPAKWAVRRRIYTQEDADEFNSRR